MASFDVSRYRQELGSCPVGATLYLFDEVDSTNRVAKELLGEGEAHGVVVLADYQRSGRGRLGRHWTAPPGSSLLQTVVFRHPPRALPTDSVMMAALAVRDAIQQCTGLAPQIKWPNDLLLAGRKFCGILTESARTSGGSYALIGIGLNVNFDPAEIPEIPPTSTSLSNEIGRTLSREALAAALYCSLDRWYDVIAEDPLVAFREWKVAVALEGKWVTVEEAHGNWQGEVIEVLRAGGLAIRPVDGRTRTVYAATISVRVADGFTTG